MTLGYTRKGKKLAWAHLETLLPVNGVNRPHIRIEGRTHADTLARLHDMYMTMWKDADKAVLGGTDTDVQPST